MVNLPIHCVYFAEPVGRVTTQIVQRKLSSINNVSEPLSSIETTSTITKAFDIAENKDMLVLHCYGIPGSGKSQLVRSLAKQFPYSNPAEATDPSSSPISCTIKWHIQCKDNKDDLKKEFKKLAEKLQEKNYIATAPLNQLDEDFKNNETKSFVEMLLNCNVPVLILIEDPSDIEIDSLKTLFDCLKKHEFKLAHPQKFHIYITSRSTSPVITKEFSALEWHKTLNVNGFSEKESINFLKKADNIEPDAEEDLIKVHERFSGMPLGLLAARSFCERRDETNYKSYLLLAEDSDYDILSDEKEAIRREYGASRAVEHVFQAIVMLFDPGIISEGDTTQILHWKLLCCISYFHYDQIPRFLLKRCCDCIRRKSVKNPEEQNKADVGELICNLVAHGMCTKQKNGAITFHEVVLNAFRLKQQSVPSFNPLKKAMETICGLLSLDLRRKENYSRMRSLQNHLQSLLEHVENNQKILVDDDDFQLLNAVTSLLYQVLAVLLINQSDSEKSNEMYRKSFDQIWSKKKNVISPVLNKSFETVAEEIKRASNDMAKKKCFLSKYLSWIKISHFEKDEVEFLKSESKSDFAEVENILNVFDRKMFVLEKLKEYKLFLADDVYLPIFYAERFASIMHGWSRNYLYSDDNQDLKNGLWMNSLSKAVSLRVKSSSGIPLLTEWLSQIGGQVPFLLKQKNNPNSLQEASRLCHKMIKDENLKMFENGLIQKAFNPPALTRISLLRYIIRINTRLVYSSSDPSFLLQADEQCERLIELIKKFRDDSSNCIAYMIYCGKYYAAREKFDSALECFRKFYHLSAEPKFDIECWAAYNYARAVRCASSTQYKDGAIQKIEVVLESNKVIKDDLKKHLEKERENLINLA